MGGGCSQFTVTDGKRLRRFHHTKGDPSYRGKRQNPADKGRVLGGRSGAVKPRGLTRFQEQMTKAISERVAAFLRNILYCLRIGS